MKTRVTLNLIQFFPFILFFQLLFSSTVFAADLEGRIVRIADGDTVTVLDGKNQQHKIRLYGIDSPERGQAFGKAAKKYLSDRLAGESVSVKKYDVDRYGRLVGVLSVGGVNINKMMIKAGYAWQFRRYCKASFCGEWLELERRARTSGLGLWQEKEPVPPWKWRRRK